MGPDRSYENFNFSFQVRADGHRDQRPPGGRPTQVQDPAGELPRRVEAVGQGVPVRQAAVPSKK